MAMYLYSSLLFLFGALYCIQYVHCSGAANVEDTLDIITKSVREASQVTDPDKTGCKCVKYNCGCCLYMHIKKIHLDDTGCVNVTYLPKDYGVSFTFSLNDKIIINQTISARNPPPICVGIPHLAKELSACIDFYNLKLSKKQFYGCVKVGFRLLHVISEDFKLGCFRIPLPGNQSDHEVWKLANALEKMTAAQLMKRKSLTFL